jgi:hypothetical protein
MNSITSSAVVHGLLCSLIPGLIFLVNLEGEAQTQKKQSRGIPESADYQKVSQAIETTIEKISQELRQLKPAFVQLDQIETLKDRRSGSDWVNRSLHYRKGATWIPPKGFPRNARGGQFKFKNQGCYILVEFRVYDAKTDPRYGTGAMSANPGPHYQVRNGGPPYGVRVTLDAEMTDSGKAFKKRVQALLAHHLKALHEDLGAQAVAWERLLPPPPVLTPRQMEKEAEVVMVATVLGFSLKRHDNGIPVHIIMKVEEVMKDRNKPGDRVKVGGELAVQAWGLDKEWLPSKGDRVRAYLKIGFVQESEKKLVPFYSFVIPNGLVSTKGPRGKGGGR